MKKPLAERTIPIVKLLPEEAWESVCGVDEESDQGGVLMAERVLRVGLLGFGTVGSSFAEVLAAHADARMFGLRMCSTAGWSGRRRMSARSLCRPMRCGPSAWRMCSRPRMWMWWWS